MVGYGPCCGVGVSTPRLVPLYICVSRELSQKTFYSGRTKKNLLYWKNKVQTTLHVHAALAAERCRLHVSPSPSLVLFKRQSHNFVGMCRPGEQPLTAACCEMMLVEKSEKCDLRKSDIEIPIETTQQAGICEQYCFWQHPWLSTRKKSSFRFVFKNCHQGMVVATPVSIAAQDSEDLISVLTCWLHQFPASVGHCCT